MKKVSFRIRNFDKEQFLTYNIDDEATLDEEVLDFMEDEEPKGLVSIIYEEEEDYDTFSYDVTDKICLSELSKQEINAEMVLKATRGLVLSLIDMREYRIPLSYLVLNRNYIYINSDYEVEFVCIPIEEMQEEVDVSLFLRSFVSSLRFESSENGDYVAKMLTYINNTAFFNLHNMVSLVEDLMEVYGVEVPEDSSVDIYVDYQEVEDVEEDSVVEELAVEDMEAEETTVTEEVSEVEEEETEEASEVEEEETEEASEVEEEETEEASEVEEEETEEALEVEEEETEEAAEVEEEETVEAPAIEEEKAEEASEVEEEETVEVLEVEEEETVEVLEVEEEETVEALEVEEEETVEALEVEEEEVDETPAVEEAKEASAVEKIEVKETSVADTREEVPIESATEKSVQKETEKEKVVPTQRKKPTLKTKDLSEPVMTMGDELDEILAEMKREESAVKRGSTGLKIKQDIKINRASIVKSNQEEFNEVEVEEKPETVEVVEEVSTKKAADIPKVNPYLIRVNTEERVMITKQNFKVGKASMGVDYTIKGNKAVSRIHAIITNKDDVYYIKDNKSTNHTVVNGKVLEDGENAELVDDCKIVLGDEEFIFKLG